MVPNNYTLGVSISIPQGGGRAVDSLTVPGGREFHFPHSFLKFRSIFLIFPQIFLIFVLILALRVGHSPTRKGSALDTPLSLPNIVLYKKVLETKFPCLASFIGIYLPHRSRAISRKQGFFFSSITFQDMTSNMSLRVEPFLEFFC